MPAGPHDGHTGEETLSCPQSPAGAALSPGAPRAVRAAPGPCLQDVEVEAIGLVDEVQRAHGDGDGELGVQDLAVELPLEQLRLPDLWHSRGELRVGRALSEPNRTEPSRAEPSGQPHLIVVRIAEAADPALAAPQPLVSSTGQEHRHRHVLHPLPLPGAWVPPVPHAQRPPVHGRGLRVIVQLGQEMRGQPRADPFLQPQLRPQPRRDLVQHHRRRLPLPVPAASAAGSGGWGDFPLAGGAELGGGRADGVRRGSIRDRVRTAPPSTPVRTDAPHTIRARLELALKYHYIY